MGTGELNARGNPGMDWHPINGIVEMLRVASCYGNGISSGLMGHLARMQTLPLPLIVPLFQNESLYKTFHMKNS